MTKKIFSFIILLSFFYFSFSQDLVDYNSRQRLEKADKYLFNEQYSDASKIYSSLLMNDYQNKYLLFQLALCYGGMKNQRSNEFNYFSKALGYEISNKPFTYIYKGYPSIIDVNVDSLLPNKKGNKASFKFDVRKAYDNFCVSEDNRFIVFVDITSSKNRVLITRKTSTGWSSPDDITTQIGSMGDCFPSFISNDGRRIYFTRYDGFDSDIYVSIFDGKSWTLIKKLNPNINTSNIEAHACETPDGLILYFASNRPDGFGNMDIYYSIKINGDWNKPVNLGARVNTDMDEDYPHITAGGNLLIFASNGIKKGAGKYEMFYSHFVTDFVWTEPTEMGYPYNTGDDDFFYTPINETSRSFL